MFVLSPKNSVFDLCCFWLNQNSCQLLCKSVDLKFHNVFQSFSVLLVIESWNIYSNLWISRTKQNVEILIKYFLSQNNNNLLLFRMLILYYFSFDNCLDISHVKIIKQWNKISVTQILTSIFQLKQYFSIITYRTFFIFTKDKIIYLWFLIYNFKKSTGLHMKDEKLQLSGNFI